MDISPQKILELGFAFWGSKALLTAVELRLFTDLAKNPRSSPADLEKRLGLHARASRDFLDTLVSLGMLKREGDRYSNTPETDTFLDRGKPSYVGGILEMANSRLYHAWGSLTSSVKSGKPFEHEQKDKDLFGELYKDPAKLREFLEAMTGVSLGAAVALARKFPWRDYKTFVDVGAAQGAVPVQVALANPHLTGKSFDLAATGPIFLDYVKSFGLQDRLGFQAGDFFKEPLPKTDVIIMGHILHDWDLSQKKMLVKKAYEALPKGGAFIAYEALIDDDRSKNAFGLLMSLNMLVETPGGFDYTGADCKSWMKEAGFRETRVEHLVGPDSMVIGLK